MGYEACGGDYWFGQFFTVPVDCYITKIRLFLCRENALPMPGIVTVSIRNITGGVPVGADIQDRTATTDGDTLPPAIIGTEGEWRDFSFAVPYPRLAAGQYAYILRDSNVGAVPNNLGQRWTWVAGDSYAESYDAGITWINTGPAIGQGLFEVWGMTAVVSTATVMTLSATDITENKATLHGRVMDDGNEMGSVRFQWGLTAVYGANTPWVGGYGTGDEFEYDLNNLAEGMDYHFRAQFKNSAGIVSGKDMVFHTLSPIGPLILITEDQAYLLEASA